MTKEERKTLIFTNQDIAEHLLQVERHVDMIMTKLDRVNMFCTDSNYGKIASVNNTLEVLQMEILQRKGVKDE